MSKSQSERLLTMNVERDRMQCAKAFHPSYHTQSPGEMEL